MVTNTINQVLQKENQAEENIAVARQHAADTVSRAKSEAELKREQIIGDARKRAEELTSKVQLDIDKMYDDAKISAEKRREEIISASSNIKANAVQVVCDVLF